MKILIICLDNIGDTVMSTVLPRALKSKFPEASITYLVKEYTKYVVCFNPFVNSTLIFNPSWLSDPLKKHFNFIGVFHLIKELRSKKFDLALVVNADWRKALLSYVSNIPERIGHKRKKASFFLTKKIPYQTKQTRHMLEDNIDLLKALQIEKQDVLPEVFSNAESDRLVVEFIKREGVSENKKIVGIHPFSLNPARSWDINKFIALCERLTDEKEVSVFLLIRKEDLMIDKSLSSIHNKLIYITNDLNLGHLIAFIKRCSVFVGNDSGPLHIASALKLPVVAILGPSNPVRFGPLGEHNIVVRNNLPCSPCGSSPECKTLECIKSITVEQVYEAVNKLLEQKVAEFETRINQ